MKRLLPFLVLVIALACVAFTLLPPRNPGVFDTVGFGRIPVLVNGRVKPIDTVARTSLLQIQGRQRVSTPEISKPFVQSPTEWLLDVLFRPEKADNYPTFRINSPDLLTLMGISDDDIKINYTGTKRIFATFGFMSSEHSRFSYHQLEAHLPELERQAKLAEPVEAQVRTPFQRAAIQLHSGVVLYQRLKYSLVSPASSDFLAELAQFQDSLAAGVTAIRNEQAGKPHDEAAAKKLIALGQHYDQMSQLGYLLAVPPPEGESNTMGWTSVGTALLATFETGHVSPYAMTYAGLARTWRAGQSEQFNHIIQLYREQLVKKFPRTLHKCDVEARFNAAQPFYTSMELYVAAFLLAIFSWLKWPDALGRSAFWLVAIAWVLATAGIGLRMWLEGRPPVTNLYSSALFVGWGSVALCLGLEAIYRNAIGSVAAGMIGFATLLIAHHLSLAGDTLEMMRAVLDSNFWLATHVVVVTTGYAATFLAGFLAIIYIVRGMFTRSLDKTTADSLTRMVYGIVCFATLFSFVGTVLGGIWADQSWGRFWGWDPKENGALIIVVWNAIILHARWGGMIKARGLMALAVFGNIVTSWSWFGTNMLGIGLHSYGFTNAAFWALSIFVASQLALIALANVPLERWRSFRKRPA
jgi:ABC-type transport system involved in cytochrome c biogenesis permease subunit